MRQYIIILISDFCVEEKSQQIAFGNNFLNFQTNEDLLKAGFER